MTTYNKDELAIVFLDYLGVTRKKIHDLLLLEQSPYKVITNKLSPKMEELLKKTKVSSIKINEVDEILKKLNSYLDENGIKVTTIISEDFPYLLKHIKPMPALLYYKGDLSLTTDDKIIGVVGTRKPTNYGRSVTQKFVSELVKEGNLITVSGLAYGVDSEVARTTLENGGHHIAVLGGGLLHIYPASNTNLSEEIVKKGGLLLSEYFPSSRPTQYTFPDRNRIISGLSRGVLVIEAGLGSGSLITATLAVEQGRDLFVVPANIDNPNFAGSNNLIQSIPGVFTSTTDYIFESLGVKKLDIKNNTQMRQLSIREQLVVDALTEGEKSTDELCEILKEEFKTANILLTDLEIDGIIKKLPGDYYVLDYEKFKGMSK